MLNFHATQNAKHFSGHLICPEDLPDNLEALLADLHRIEDQFPTAARDTGLPASTLGRSLNLEARIENLANASMQTLFDDRHLYCGTSWRLLILQCVGHCYMSFDLDKLERLVRIRNQVPPLFATLFPEDMEAIPSQMNTFVFALEEVLDEGAALGVVKELGELHGLARFGVVMKTWLDHLADVGQIKKAVRNGQITYWSHDIS